MKTVIWVVLLVLFSKGRTFNVISSNVNSTRPQVVNIGALVCFNSSIGKVAKVAINTAVEDVNSNPAILKGTKLKVTMQDTKTSHFLGIIEALRFMENETVAIIGPQFSVTAHVISHIANELQVPILSFAATDATLGPPEFPFFVRTTHSDAFQMAAVADIVGYYEWRHVIAIYVEDGFGRNGIAALGDKLAEKRCRISYKAPISPRASKDEILKVLIKVSSMESRILILHGYENWGLHVLNEAQNLQMMEIGYVWIATDWLSTVLDTEPKTIDNNNNVQGVLTLRMHTPDSKLKTKFVSRWTNLTGINNDSLGLNTYGLYAYDSVWALATAIDSFLDDHEGTFSFSNDSSLLNELGGGKMKLDSVLRISDGGKLLLRSIKNVNISGLSGELAFNSDMELIDPVYEVINVIGTGFRRIGYWSNSSGLSILPPETLREKQKQNHSNGYNSSTQLYGVVWPGQTINKPRGWVLPSNGKRLRIGIPTRVTDREFITRTDGDSNHMFSGFCMEVFYAALDQLEYGVPYTFYPFGNGRTNTPPIGLLRMLPTGELDAVVGDVTITTRRAKIVDFTQPYIESGLVVVAPVRKLNSSAWAFLRPFTPILWCVTAGFFLLVGAVVWILERRTNEDFQGPPSKQVGTIMWFGFSTLFFAQRERTSSSLARFLLIIWLFVVLVLNSSYTASLTSMLTVEQLSSPVKGIESLVTSREPIGYAKGSFAVNYLTTELNIQKSRLVPLESPEEFEKALKAGPSQGGIAALVHERAYMEPFLSTRCEFSIVGQQFTNMGWGFAFPRDSPLAVDMSTAILKLSESGKLRRIHDQWLMKHACSSEGAKQEVERLPLESFWGLFLFSGLACFLVLFLYLIKMLRQYSKHSLSSSQSDGSIRSFLAFLLLTEQELIQSKRRQIDGA